MIRRLVPIVLLAVATGAAAQEIGFATPPDVAPQLPVGTYSPHYVAGGNISEIWNFVFDFPSRDTVALQFMVTNIGPGDFTGAVIAYLVPAGAEPIIIKNSRAHGDWQDRSDEQGPWLHIARHELRLEDRSFDLQVVSDHAVLDLEGEVLSDMFRPGRLSVGDGEWYDLTVFGPRMRAAGAITWPDGSVTRLEDGRGMGMHSLSTVSEDRLATSWLRIDTFDARDQVSVFELMTSRELGRRRHGFALRFRDDSLLGWSYRYGRRLLDAQPDPEKSDYLIARGMRFGAVRGEPTESAGVVDFRGEASLELLMRNELLAFLNSPVLRFVLRMITDPILYQYRATYTLSLDFEEPEAGEVSGQGIVSIYFLNPAPAVF